MKIRAGMDIKEPKSRNNVCVFVQYVEAMKQQTGVKTTNKTKTKESSRNTLRIQDKELLEMSDNGEIYNLLFPCLIFLLIFLNVFMLYVWHESVLLS